MNARREGGHSSSPPVVSLACSSPQHSALSVRPLDAAGMPLAGTTPTAHAKVPSAPDLIRAGWRETRQRGRNANRLRREPPRRRRVHAREPHLPRIPPQRFVPQLHAECGKAQESPRFVAGERAVVTYRAHTELLQCAWHTPVPRPNRRSEVFHERKRIGQAAVQGVCARGST